MPDIEALRTSLLRAITLEKGDYRYIVHPISDGIPRLEASVLEETARGLAEILNWDADVIVTPEAMGIPIATALMLSKHMPLTIVRKRTYGMEGEVEIKQQTGYGTGTFYLNGLKRGDRVILVDCVVSTGSTLIGIIEALIKLGAKIVDICCVYGKEGGREQVFETTGLRVKTLLEVRIDSNGRVVEM